MLALYLSLLNSEEEKKTFQEIYYSYRSLLYQVANQILKDTWLSEDAVQNTILALVKNMEKISVFWDMCNENGKSSLQKIGKA